MRVVFLRSKLLTFMQNLIFYQASLLFDKVLLLQAGLRLPAFFNLGVKSHG